MWHEGVDEAEATKTQFSGIEESLAPIEHGPSREWTDA